MLILNNNILEKLIELICPNNAIRNDVFSNQDYLCQQSFLQKKRNLENNYIIQKYENIFFPNKNNNDQIKYYPEYNGENFLFAPKLINLAYNYDNQFKWGDPVNNNIIKQNTINNINFNLKGDHFNYYLPKKYIFESIKEDIYNINNINSNNIKGNLNDKINKKISMDCNESKNALSNKNINFDIIRVKEKNILKNYLIKKLFQMKLIMKLKF